MSLLLYALALSSAFVCHHFPAPSLSRHRPTPQLAALCSSRPFIPSSFHPSIRLCLVIYNSSGILLPSTPLHQDSINILFGPQLHCTHVCFVCLRNESQASQGSIWNGYYCGCCSVLALPPSLCHCGDQIACLAVCLLVVNSVSYFFSSASICAESAAGSTFLTLCNIRKQCSIIFKRTVEDSFHLYFTLTLSSLTLIPTRLK